MGFDPTELSGYTELDEAAGEDFAPLKPGVYRLAISAKNSKVLLKNGVPRLQVGMVVVDGENEGRRHTEFFNWFGAASGDPTTLGERQASTRKVTNNFFRAIIKCQSGSPDGEAETSQEVINALNTMAVDDDAVEEMIESLYDILDDEVFIGRLRKKNDGNSLFVFRDWEEGEKALD